MLYARVQDGHVDELHANLMETWTGHGKVMDFYCSFFDGLIELH